jgi:basic membrane lipoprotein Med (substrate-binding protein (PBP1-ABC) superfamily)
MYYVDTMGTVLDGSWETHQYWGGLQEGVVELAEFSAKVPDDVKATVKAAEERILSGDWDVFCGPINGQDGSEKVAEGQCMNDGDMLGMNWFVEGVAGTIPSQ